jgi:hypothetical protein
MQSGSVANLLGTNLTYVNTDSDIVKWRVNIKAIKDNYDKIVGFENGGSVYTNSIRVILGEKSHYHPAAIFQKVFPRITNSDIVKIIGAGHWVHADKPMETIQELKNVLDKIDNKNN